MTDQQAQRMPARGDGLIGELLTGETVSGVVLGVEEQSGWEAVLLLIGARLAPNGKLIGGEKRWVLDEELAGHKVYRSSTTVEIEAAARKEGVPCGG